MSQNMFLIILFEAIYAGRFMDVLITFFNDNVNIILFIDAETIDYLR